MKKIIIALFSSILVFLLIFISFLIFAIINYTTILSCYFPTNYYFYRMHKIIVRGDKDWDGEVERIFHHLQNCNYNKRQLAEKLLADKDGTIVSLGMDLIVLESLPDGDILLSKYQNDQRWNFNMKYNSQYSKFLLVVWKIKNNIQLNEKDKEIVTGWSKDYFTRLGVEPI